ncbi:hypothetical protein CAEBREN_12292 [Caenorhabditis brenneri]|uniref:Uncharacterized protein n=1 Tax=Caenorhabditis brenneri TaxID=135651 RepID=G0MX70_CAEBE|nr:hypothetical protein CAEBREN_12292 [Caenorhabditis brenneri]
MNIHENKSVLESTVHNAFGGKRSDEREGMELRTHGSYWGKSIITYRLKQPSQRMSLSQQREVFAKAFAKDIYWVMTKYGDMMNGYPKKISAGLTDTPDGISAALYYHEDGKPYFFRKSYFWQYSRHGKQKPWPQAISSIFDDKDYPPEIDAAFQLNNTSSFLFYQNKYWKVSGNPMRVETGYPRSLAKDWFNCL